MVRIDSGSSIGIRVGAGGILGLKIGPRALEEEYDKEGAEDDTNEDDEDNLIFVDVSLDAMIVVAGLQEIMSDLTSVLLSVSVHASVRMFTLLLVLLSPFESDVAMVFAVGLFCPRLFCNS